jgi:hypothetical protein
MSKLKLHRDQNRMERGEGSGNAHGVKVAHGRVPKDHVEGSGPITSVPWGWRIPDCYLSQGNESRYRADGLGRTDLCNNN